MDLIKTQLLESVFAGGGEMGSRMRALDWSATVLGPWEKCPQSLRACVGVMLGSGYQMLVCSAPAIRLASARTDQQERGRAEALAEIDRDKTAFLTNVSRECRTPLALMFAPLEELLPEAREPEKETER